jgi:hypothetical protein
MCRRVARRAFQDRRRFLASFGMAVSLLGLAYPAFCFATLPKGFTFRRSKGL